MVPETNLKFLSKNQNDSRYLICLVGISPPNFQGGHHDKQQKSEASTSPSENREKDLVEIREIIPSLVPEALVTEYSAYGTSRDVQEGPDLSGHDDSTQTAYLSSDSIHTRALELLNLLRNAFCLATHPWKRILLAGYEFGGLIIKQVFMGQPDETRDLASWDDLFASIIRSSGIKYHGRMAHVLAGLSNDALVVSSRFHRFITRYTIVHMREALTVDQISDLVIDAGTNKDLDPKSRVGDLRNWFRFDKNNIDELEGLRSCFAPLSLLSKDNRTDGESEELCLNFLEMLSPSRLSIYEIDDDSELGYIADLEDVYFKHLHQLDTDTASAKKLIQIIGPPEHGKSSLLKIIRQKLREKVPTVILEYWTEHSSNTGDQTSIYDILVVFIRQMISQNPASFSLIFHLVAEYFEGDAWTQSNLQSIFDTLLSNLGLAILVVVQNLGNLSEEVQGWFQQLGLSLDRLNLKYHFLISSDKSAASLTSGPSGILDLGVGLNQANQAFLRAKLRALANDIPYFKSLRNEEREWIRQVLETNVNSMGDSLMLADLYIRYLTSRIPNLSNRNSVELEIERSPKTRQKLFEHQVKELKGQIETTLHWSTLLLSWVLNTFRPLNIQELAVALAIQLGNKDISELDGRVCRDMISDIKRYLGLFIRTDNEMVFLLGSKTEFTTMLSGLGDEQTVQILGHEELSKYCLNYLTAILLQTKDDRNLWERCQSQASRAWAHEIADIEHSNLGFLDYAVRFWPQHYSNAVKSRLDDSLDDEVIAFLTNTDICSKWFQLYLSANGCLYKESQEARLLESSIGRNETSGSGSETDGLYIARYLGLRSVVSKLTDKTDVVKGDVAYQEVTITRGKWVRRAIFSGTTGEAAKDFLNAVICNDGDAEIQRLMESETFTSDKTSHLFIAAQSGILSSTKLLSDGAKIQETNASGRTAMHFAVLGGNIDVVSHLQQIGVSVDQKDATGETPLLLATKVGNLELAKLLIASGADCTIEDSNKKVPLEYAIIRLQLQTASEANLQVLDAFLGIEYSPSRLSSILRTASTSGNILIFQKLLEAWKSQVDNVISMQDDEGRTVLHLAASTGQKIIVETLLKTTIDLGIRDNSGFLPQHWAAKHGHLEVLKILPDCLENDDWPLLYLASEAGQFLVVQYLLSQKFHSPNTRGEDKERSPLIIATIQGHAEILKLLLASGGDPDTDGKDRRTPLHEAVEKGYMEVCRNLINAKADVNARDIQRRTPLHIATAAGNSSIVELLLESGADSNVTNRKQSTPLHLGIKHSEIVRLLLKHGADMEAKNSIQRTPLMLACASGYDISVEVLLQNGAAINEVDETGFTALFLAAKEGHLKIVEMFSKIPESLPIALRKAIRVDDTETFRTILDLIPAPKDILEMKNFNCPLLVDAIFDCRWDIVDIILAIAIPDNSSALDYTDGFQQTPLFIAVHMGSPRVVKTLLDAKANPELGDEAQSTPLHASANRYEMAQLLLSYNANINCQQKNKYTPLMLAVSWGAADTTEMFLANNADTEIANTKGETALHIAARQGNTAILKLLLQKGADVAKRTVRNKTALHLTLKSGVPDAVRLLLDNGANLEDYASKRKTSLYFAAAGGEEVLKVVLEAGKERGPELWTHQQIEDALLSACGNVKIESIKILLNEHPWLSANNNLDECSVRLIPRKIEAETDLPFKLLDLGLDPFKRWGEKNVSSFELAVVSAHEIRNQFLKACISRVGEDLSSFGNGFRVLRNAIELKSEEMWEKFKRLQGEASRVVDDDNWTLDHHLLQAGDTFPIKPPKIPGQVSQGPKTWTMPYLWRRWSLDQDLDSRFEFENDCTEIAFKLRAIWDSGGNRTWDEVSIRSDHPFPPRGMGRNYFEIEIQKPRPCDIIPLPLPYEEQYELRVYVGFCGEFSFLANAACGWKIWSVGYHGDDAKIYTRSPSGKLVHDTDDKYKYGFGNIVGCGINHEKGEYFFTLDGKVVATFEDDMIFRKMYPVVGHVGQPCKIRVNFGDRSFAWEEGNT
ncbi:hypothetical protein TWF694_006270 [Orbilia ellipsospora]|uniref:protein S-acyltransferase n=1 Tax=Orbilia ellipsospora TaxID=2528407 RepID=A0AAV9XKJ2_9PEZI